MTDLDGRRIAAITTAPITSHYPRIIGRNARLGVHGTGPTSTAVAVSTADGAIGWGLATGPTGDLQQLIGRDVASVFEPCTGVTDDDARPLDLALHDLAGVVLDRPVHQLIGGHGGPGLSCYSGAIYFDDLDADDASVDRGVDAVLANAAADVESGYRALKLKIGRGHRWLPREAGLARDIAVVAAVRAAYPEIEILVDANDGYTLADTTEFLDATADCRLFWLEEPFVENRADLTALYAHVTDAGLPILLADGETAAPGAAQPDVDALLDLAAAGVLDVLLMDVVSYGFTGWRAVMPRLVDAGVTASPHAWGEPLKTAYAAQLAAGLGNVLTVEGVPGTVDGVDLSGYAVRAGALTVPSAPGFGLPLPAVLGGQPR